MDLRQEPQTQKLPHFFILPFPTKRDVACALILFISLIITSIVFFNLVTPFYPHLLLPFSFSKTLPDSQLPGSPNTCDYSYGKWVWDETYPTQKYTEDCPFLDPGFRCHRNGRRDVGYVKWRWKPHECDLPRFDAIDFLERSRNGRIVFAGDSIGRNQWESLLCMLSHGVSNIKRNASTVLQSIVIPDVEQDKKFLPLTLI